MAWLGFGGLAAAGLPVNAFSSGSRLLLPSGFSTSSIVGEIQRNFVHAQVAAEDVPETITDIQFRRSEERRLPGGLHFQIPQGDLFEGTEARFRRP